MTARSPKMRQGTMLTETVPLYSPGFEAQSVRRDAVLLFEAHVERAGEEAHACLA
jgi:hypothetical protein